MRTSKAQHRINLQFAYKCLLTMDAQLHDTTARMAAGDNDDAVSENQISYERTLRDELSQKQEVVLDFTSLKACLDPQREKTEGEQFNYEEFLCQELCKGVAFSKVEVLKVRHLAIPQPLTPQTEDYYADLLHGIMQLSNLVELDLSGNKLPQDLQKHLKFWNLERLKRLYLDNMGLTSLPSSVGRLRQLEVLSANSNSLVTLPVTLAFCENLRELNLKDNKFNRVPSVVLKLPHLEDLRRLGNPLPQLFNGFEVSPHINVQTPLCAKQTNTVFNPSSLQSLCAKAAFTNKIDYWNDSSSVGPLQCRTLDCFASEFTLCHHCNKDVHYPRMWTVDVMLLRYLDLRFVPVLFTTCSVECQSVVLQQYRDLQTKTQTDIDTEYETSVKEAETEAGIESRTCRVNQSRTATRRHRKHMCNIM